jgi:hypothetical protein
MTVRYAPNDASNQIELIAWLKEEWWHSRFTFLSQLRGLRLGCTHGLHGTTGSGKSSLLKDILSDCLKAEECFLISTEENIKRVVADLKLIDATTPIQHLKYYHKDDTPEEVRGNYKELWRWYMELILSSGCRAIFWDNPSTSDFYSVGMSLAGQEYLWEQLQKLVRQHNLMLFYTIHTAPSVHDGIGRLIEGEEVRGSKQSFQQADYWFILQRFQIGNKFYPFVRVRKHRFHRFVDQFYFHMVYQDGHFTKDKAVDFQDISDAFLQRNVLGGKKK